MKYAVSIMILAIIATLATADLELTVDIEYPKRLELKIPVKEASDFEMRTSFGDSEYFIATGHVGRITGLSSNRMIEMTHGYEYKLGGATGSARGTESYQLQGKYKMKIRLSASIYTANPAFVIREVEPPPLPQLNLTNMTILSNSTATITDNDVDRTAQPTNAPYPSVDEAIDVVSQLRLGMSQQAAASVREKNKVTDNGLLSSGFSDSRFWCLSERYHLVLRFSGQRNTNDPASGGVLTRVSIQDGHKFTNVFEVTNMGVAPN